MPSSIDIIQPLLHASGQAIMPFIVGRLIMAVTVLIDLDHLPADPIYDPNAGATGGLTPLHTL